MRSDNSDYAKCSMKLNPLPWLFSRWLQSEVPKWSAAGVIRPEQERQILEQCEAKTLCPSVARCANLTLAALAAIALGLALVLIVTSHWQSIPWAVKFVPVIVVMTAAHCAGYWYRFQRGQ